MELLKMRLITMDRKSTVPDTVGGRPLLYTLCPPHLSLFFHWPCVWPQGPSTVASGAQTLIINPLPHHIFQLIAMNEVGPYMSAGLSLSTPVHTLEPMNLHEEQGPLGLLFYFLLAQLFCILNSVRANLMVSIRSCSS